MLPKILFKEVAFHKQVVFSLEFGTGGLDWTAFQAVQQAFSPSWLCRWAFGGCVSGCFFWERTGSFFFSARGNFFFPWSRVQGGARTPQTLIVPTPTEWRWPFVFASCLSAVALVGTLFLCDNPAPALPSPAAPTCPHALGSLSHALEHLAPGYVPLPDHPETQPPSHVRDQYYAGNQDGARGGAARGGKGGGGGFYSDSDSDSDSDSSSGSDYTSDSDSEDDSSDSSDSDSDSDSDSGSSSSAYTSSDDSDGSGSGSESEDESDEEEEEEEEEEAAASDDDDASDDDAGDAAGDAGGAAGDEDAKVKRGEASESEASESSDDEDASDSD